MLGDYGCTYDEYLLCNLNKIFVYHMYDRLALLLSSAAGHMYKTNQAPIPLAEHFMMVRT